jgi:hypothetical protein
MDVSSFVLHTRFSRVVFPAFALPITRIRKRVYLARSFAASSGPIITAGAGAAGGTGATGGPETGGDEAAGGVEEAGGGTVTDGGRGTGGGAVTTGEPTTVEGEFERLGGVLCDPSPKAFFSRLRSPLDSLTVCWRSSAI